MHSAIVCVDSVGSLISVNSIQTCNVALRSVVHVQRIL